jgi:hypothetical protein
MSKSIAITLYLSAARRVAKLALLMLLPTPPLPLPTAMIVGGTPLGGRLAQDGRPLIQPLALGLRPTLQAVANPGVL